MLQLKDEQISIKDWEELLKNSIYSTPFQTPVFYELYRLVQNYTAKIFAIEINGKLKSLCVVTIQNEQSAISYFSKRAIIYGGPLISEDGYASFSFLLKFIHNELKRDVIYIEIRNSVDYSRFRQTYNQLGWNYVPYLNFQLKVESINYDGILAKMKYNRRREINQSVKEGVFYYEAHDVSQIKTLYSILFELYKVKVKLPLPSIDFFIELFNSTIGKVFIVEHNNTIIGGSFCFYLEGRAIYTMYYCGLRNYNKKIFPTHLAVMAAIQFALTHKLKMVDFMGAGKPDVDYGVRKYKSEFGGDLVEHGRFLSITKPMLYRFGSIALKILKKF
jgi:serine/alanine adding enzyme